MGKVKKFIHSLRSKTSPSKGKFKSGDASSHSSEKSSSLSQWTKSYSRAINTDKTSPPAATSRTPGSGTDGGAGVTNDEDIAPPSLPSPASPSDDSHDSYRSFMNYIEALPAEQSDDSHDSYGSFMNYIGALSSQASASLISEDEFAALPD
ncbi:hypothetical protein N0V83_001595 [Neocucurbitaria cava]|uniref:Uncharacterized protein n=1 Tax=Neocucurbitaria cava TaxID=798079 RepID=A0A9W9CQJ2_9PLEO|nr:hypothetical protein N0V83_001595 [Neocucurbitaria cava]